MSCNHKLEKCISDVSRSNFVTKLQYKAETGMDVRSLRWINGFHPVKSFQNVDTKTKRNLSISKTEFVRFVIHTMIEI